MSIELTNPYQGIFTKAQFRQGKIATPGTRSTVNVGGSEKQFVAVKLPAGTYINGSVLILDAAGVMGAAVTASGAPIAAINQRVGVLVFNSATATQTLGGTCFAWAQVYGDVLARVSASVTLPGIALGMGAGAGALIQQAGSSVSAMMHGITAITTNTASTTAELLLSVFLNYPCFIGPPDTNLA